MSTDLNQKIYIAGHHGMVGSVIMRNLQAQGYTNIVARTHVKLDLTNQAVIEHFFKTEKPDQLYLAAEKVGGIHENNAYPAESIYDNLMVQNNLFHQVCIHGLKKLLFLGSSCIYPKLTPQPMAEDALLAGKLDSTHEPYAIAKIAGINMCESYNRQHGQSYGVDYRSVMPTNLYGLGDSYHPKNSHVIFALIRRFHETKVSNDPEVVIWGADTPKREFLYVDDMAAASVFVMLLVKAAYDSQTDSMQSHINVDFDSDVTIEQLATAVGAAIKGNIDLDANKSDGAPRKWMDSRRLNSLGWKPRVNLDYGLAMTYRDYLNGAQPFK